MKVGIIGPGRAGLGLALALKKAGVTILGVHGRRNKTVPRSIPFSVGGEAPWLSRADVVLLAVRDDALAPLVSELLRASGRRRGQVFLHLSGALPAAELGPLKRRGARIGAMHPLMTVSADPRRAARHFQGAAFALEGDPAAVRAARRLARALGGEPVQIRARERAKYHAGAVFASNYVVAVLDIGQRLLEQAGFGEKAARRALAPLTRASVGNEAAHGPEAALTGPIIRGDLATVKRHLAALDAPTRALYRSLGTATVRLAQRAGLPAARARALLKVLGGSSR